MSSSTTITTAMAGSAEGVPTTKTTTTASTTRQYPSLSERLIQARNTRRSLNSTTTTTNSNNASTSASTSSPNEVVVTTTGSSTSQSSLEENENSISKTATSTTSGVRSRYNPGTIHHQQHHHHPSIIASKSSGGASTSSTSTVITANNNPTVSVDSSSSNALHQRYRTLPGLVSTTTTTSTATTSSATTTASSKASQQLQQQQSQQQPVVLGRYRPSSSNKGSTTTSSSSSTTTSAVGMTSPPSTSTNRTPLKAATTSATTSAATTSSSATAASPVRTWKNIHEIVQKMEEKESSSGNSQPSSSSHGKTNNNIYSSKGGIMNTNEGAAVADNSINEKSPPPQPRAVRTYRNLHNTLQQQQPTSATSNPIKKTTATTSEPTTSSNQNQWKLKQYNSIMNGTTTVNNDNTNSNSSTNSNGKSTPEANNTIGIDPSSIESSVTTSKKVVAAPHSYVPTSQPTLYSFVPSPPPPTTSTNGSSNSTVWRKKIGSNNNIGGGGSSSSYYGNDETSTILSTNSNISTASSTPSVLAQLMSPAAAPPNVSPSYIRTVSNCPPDVANPTPTAAVAATAISPTSLSLTNSRSFGSQYSQSITKSPSQESTTLSATPSWKNSVGTKKKDGSTGGSGNVVYGSPIPAWKKKLLEQQRVQQQEQEQKAKAIPKWKQKQLELQQQQQQEQGSTIGKQTSNTTHDIVTTIPSDEVRDEVIDPNDHLTSTLSNLAVVDEEIGSVDVVVQASDTTTSKVSSDNNKKWPPSQQQQQPSSDKPTMASSALRPRLRLGASPDNGIDRQSENNVPSKKAPWLNRTPPTAYTNKAAADIVGVPSEDTYSNPSPEKEDPAEQSGIGESTTLLSPRRRENLTVNSSLVDASSNNDATTSGGRNIKQWESPRTARLEAMKANATSTTPSSIPYTRPESKSNSSSVVVPNHPIKSPDASLATGKKWQPPKNEKDSTTENIQSPLRSITEIATDDSGIQLSVAQMKAKLWGTGKAEKLVVPPKESSSVKAIVSDCSPAVFNSPVRSNNHFNDRTTSMKTPPKSATKSSYQYTSSSSPVPPTFTRGRPDVCTPNGPLPPQRSSSRGERSILAPPRRNLDDVWMNRLEHVNPETGSSPSLIPDGNTESNTNNAALSAEGRKDGYSEQVHGLDQQQPIVTVSPPPPPPSEAGTHYRSPSVGDFQVSELKDVKETVESLSIESLSSPPTSPRLPRPDSPVSPQILPAVMTKFDTSSHQHTQSPTARRLPPKLPPTSPVVTKHRGQSHFSETIDSRPIDDSERWGTDTDITGPKEFMDYVHEQAPISPQLKEDRPWKKDSNSLPQSSWAKHSIDAPADDVELSPPRTRRDDPPMDGALVAEEKKTNDTMQSPSSLMRLAADSIHAVDYDKAVQGLQRRSIMDDEDDSQVSGGTPGSAIPSILPPEFEKAMSDNEGFPTKNIDMVFGDPSTFGSAGGEGEVETPIRVSDRAKALDSWNGGLGPKNNDAYKTEIAPTLSPIYRETSDNELDGMSPRTSKRGFALDDWKRAKSFDSKSDFETSSDFWQPSITDNQSQTDDKDWYKIQPDMEDANLGLSASANTDHAAPTPATTLLRNAVPILEKSKMDTDGRPKMTWKKKPIVPKSDRTNVPPRPVSKGNSTKVRKSEPSQPSSTLGQMNNHQQTTNNFDPFDPFEFSFTQPDSSKVEFTEATEFSESSDYFGSVDPFPNDPTSFPIIQEQKVPTTPKIREMEHKRSDSAPTEEYDENDETEVQDYLYGDNESPPTLSGLNPPSGSNLSQYEVWSYDADISNFQDGAAEI